MAQKVYNPNDGLTGRDGGPYLDEVQTRAAEKRRAEIEGREPDYDNPPATAGIQLSTAAQILGDLKVTNSIPSRQNHVDHTAAEFYSAAEGEIGTSVRAWGEIPGTVEEVEEVKEVKAGDKVGETGKSTGSHVHVKAGK